MRRISAFLLFLLVLLAPTALAAQQTYTPTLSILNIRNYPVLQPGDAEVSVQFEVQNNGQTASPAATATLTEISSGQVVASADVKALQPTEIYTVTLTFPASAFPAGTHQSFRAGISVNNAPLPNVAQIGIDFPGAPAQGGLPQMGVTPSPGGPGVAATSSSGVPIPTLPAEGATPSASGTPTTINLFGRTIELPANLDLKTILNPVYFAGIIAVCGVGLILIWVVTVILRLLFQKPPSFETWQPPYSAIAFLDPNTPQGRRQSWQQHAQNDAITAAPVEGNYHIRKLLAGINGSKLTGWRVSAMRISQYDMYGRVARSQTLMKKGVVNRLDKAVRKSDSLDDKRAEKAVRPVAKALVEALTKRMNKRNDMLPVALDIRFKGIHGEVRIIFELFQAMNGQWAQIDHWEPDMTVPSGAIQENYTYSFYGRRTDENGRAFRKRLIDDMTRTLKEMVKKAETGQPAPAAPILAPPTENLGTPISTPTAAGGLFAEPPIQGDDTAHGLGP
jgi:CARDB protein